MAKDRADRIGELASRCEALENTVEAISDIVFEPKMALPRVKRKVAAP